VQPFDTADQEMQSNLKQIKNFLIFNHLFCGLIAIADQRVVPAYF
jgi:hypothetical protein